MSERSVFLLAPLRIEALALSRAGVARVERTGMGAARAEMARARLQRTLPPGAPVGLVGFAGGLSPADRPGDVVVATELVTLDGTSPRHELDGELAEKVRAALARAGRHARSGRIVSVRKLVPAGITQKEPGAAGALACDMESAWLAPLAEHRPFAVVRVIVDHPRRGLFGPWVIPAGVAAWRQLAAIAPVLVSQLEGAITPVMTR